ncbi:HD domain-containing protein [Tenacibaculum finnmarkense genomovar finnmarkense]|uniref:HD domain-containing protein n=1 Tax=Tenacibaculum finnmarkense genomovar finnmarkense TaxID=1458503 RepID=A0AAP1RFY9_9FLAO|nr:HD domain-containing protein [Tenacibaculum finnmarkense]MBE7652776.1 HD domain-containing protein [Tenacibaculum finnmarkense genomovar finnmarkense]MBE7695178.1 HD domain-containing protein [Tenacibaculum finnmarkense genomovar finnmarkense]MCD8402718.1 HD domain-containing protein [Tenacibaculum finnmarkense genomovar finnmarkense]MCD8411851.1 HD domain-containing protein [Tenacibaculum finnmarkense genomovar ulcerans]MCD8417889.1 HD domain-containing protein [Tenacibaculum finnmarkense 
MKNRKPNKLKIINDPIYGFITIPNTLIFDIIEHPYFQRLRRVSQMGLSNMVYPGANHTRFHHAIGCMHLMQKAVHVLRNKEIAISDDEANALYVAILLHDIGHGAFSHALEHSIVSGVSHEEISLKFMKALNDEFGGKLSLAIQIFEGKYPRKFLYQLISSQLDIDRLDYLKRDSFYTGVTEGNISSDRLIAMMNVVKDQLVIEEKGIYSVEQFIIARRLMYWQVYLHKTCLVAENTLVNVLKRAKELASKGIELPAGKALKHFLYNPITQANFTKDTLEIFAELDDYDVMWAIKEWVHHNDFVLSCLSKMIIRRNLLKIEIQKEPFGQEYITKVYKKVLENSNIKTADLNYFVLSDKIKHQAYITKNPIKIYTKKGKLKDIAKASDQLNLKALTKPVVKHYICYPKKTQLV